MHVDSFTISNDNIAIFLTDGTLRQVSKAAFESWMHDNDKLLFSIEDESTGIDFIPLTIEQFWQAHDSYICNMLESYLQPVAEQETSLYDLL